MTTESKELREETDRNQRLMASIFEAIQDGICILDPDMRIVQTNPRMENMYGNGQPMADQACYKVFHNRETPCDPCPARETFLEGKNKTFTQAARFRSGASGWVEVNAFPICDEAGRVVQVIESVRNVTERKKAEDLLRKNQDFLNGILQSLPDKIAVRDTDLRIIHCNWEEQAPETLLDQAMRVQTAVCGDGPCDQCVVQQAFITHETMQVRKEDPVSGRIWEISAYPVVDQNDEATMLIEYFHDITDKKEASEELVRIRAALDDATDGIIVLSREGKVTYMNLAFAEAFRCTADSLNEKGIQTIFTDQSIAKQLFAATFNYDSWTHEVMMEAGDGRQFPALLRATPILNDNIEAIGALLVINDISERKQMERQILQSQKLESIGQLAAGVAHEINTPTQYVGDNTRFLEDGFGDLSGLIEKYRALAAQLENDPNYSEAIAGIREAEEEADLEYLVEEIPKAITQSLEGIEHVATIVRAMKDFSHPGLEERTAIDLNGAISSTVTIAKNEWKYVADIETNFKPDLPLVRCLPGEINQVILNLIINAAHAIGDVVADTNGKGCITISTDCDDDWAIVRIADTGSGIPEEIRGRIFDPFFTTKQVGKGSGQGLAISHSVIVEKHKGKLSFETEMGQGTTFIIHLPLKENQEA